MARPHQHSNEDEVGMSRRHKRESDEEVYRVEVDSEPEELEDEPVDAEHAEAEGLEAERDELAEHIAALQSELEKLKADAAESHNRYLRAIADFDNYRKRQREEIARRVNLAREELLLKILPIVDNFERAVQAAEAQHNYDSLVEGVNLTLRQMKEMLAREGVEPIEAVGREFNPELHEAMMRVETDEYPENTIVEELEKGYTIDGRVLRPSRVKVAASG